MKLAVAAFTLAFASAAVPPPATTFCATLHQSLSAGPSDGSSPEVEQSVQYQLSCMNYDTISWRQDTLSDPTDGSSPIQQRTIYAGDGVTYFLLMKDDGVTIDQCAYLDGVNTQTELPFTLQLIDDDAENEGSANVDDTDVNDWFKFRKGSKSGSFSFPDEYMHWYVTDDGQMIQSDCVQYYGSQPLDGGNSTIQHGRRHYEDFDADAALDDSLYAFPSDQISKDDCIPAQQEHIDALNKMTSFRNKFFGM